MQLASIQIFCEVARWASFSRGARESGVSQPSASQAVRQIEQRLGVQLFDRSKRPLNLTPQGEVYYEGCKGLIARYAEVETRVRSLAGGESVVGTARVASIYSVGLAHMSGYVRRFADAHPRAEVKLEYLHPSRVVEAVRDETADLGLVSFPRKWPDLTVIPWRDEEMVLAVHPKHPLAALGTVDVAALAGECFVALDPDLAIRRHTDKFLRRHGVNVRPSLEFDNIETIKRAVELPAGVALLPLPTLAREVESGTLAAVRLRDHCLSRPLAIVHRGPATLPSAASSFLALLTAADPASKPRAAQG